MTDAKEITLAAQCIKKFGIFSTKDYVGNVMPNGHMGFEIPKIDKDALLKKIEEVKV